MRYEEKVAKRAERFVPGLKVERAMNSATIGSCIALMVIESVDRDAQTAVLAYPETDVRYTVSFESIYPWPTWDHQRPGSELAEERRKNLELA